MSRCATCASAFASRRFSPSSASAPCRAPGSISYSPTRRAWRRRGCAPNFQGARIHPRRKLFSRARGRRLGAGRRWRRDDRRRSRVAGRICAQDRQVGDFQSSRKRGAVPNARDPRASRRPSRDERHFAGRRLALWRAGGRQRIGRQVSSNKISRSCRAPPIFWEWRSSASDTSAISRPRCSAINS